MGSRPSEHQLVRRVPSALATLLDVPEKAIKSRHDKSANVDLLVSAVGQTFAVEVISASAAGPVAAHAAHVAEAAKKLRSRAIPLVAVPFMTEAGRRACAVAQVPWFDLSGNGHIVAPGLRVIIDGRPNRFRELGRPASVFAPKSARVVRWLLMNPTGAFTQRELARVTGLTEGFVSRIVSRLEADSYVARIDVSGAGDGAGEGDGTGEGRRGKAPIRLRDPGLLLDAWEEEYRFDKHTLLRGHIAARSGDALAQFLSDRLGAAGLEHAATGLAAAWQMNHFASFRIATFFLAEEPSDEFLGSLGYRDDPRGANTWLVIPNDSGVFQGAELRDGVRCVHPVQAYLDLKQHPERAKEAAERLRSEMLNWKRDA